jgi:hypothetical protein
MGVTKVNSGWNAGELVFKNVSTGKPVLKISDSLSVQTKSANYTMTAADSGYETYIDTDAFTITLPSTVAGLTYTFVNAGSDGTVKINIAPAAADKIQGCGLTAADNKALINTKATAKFGDKVTIVGDGGDGWIIQSMIGTWAREA